MNNEEQDYSLYWLKRKGNADKWLRDNGISQKSFLTTEIELLQVQLIAKNLLKQHSRMLTTHQCTALNAFLHLMTSQRQRKGISRALCFRVMNMGKAINRQRFKQHRHTQAH